MPGFERQPRTTFKSCWQFASANVDIALSAAGLSSRLCVLRNIEPTAATALMARPLLPDKTMTPLQAPTPCPVLQQMALVSATTLLFFFLIRTVLRLVPCQRFAHCTRHGIHSGVTRGSGCIEGGAPPLKNSLPALWCPWCTHQISERIARRLFLREDEMGTSRHRCFTAHCARQLPWCPCQRLAWGASRVVTARSLFSHPSAASPRHALRHG